MENTFAFELLAGASIIGIVVFIIAFRDWNPAGRLINKRATGDEKPKARPL